MMTKTLNASFAYNCFKYQILTILMTVNEYDKIENQLKVKYEI